MYVQSLTQAIGNTPLLEVNCPGSNARLLLKLECFNPGGSVKDRVALSMIEDAERRGLLHPGSVIIEPTSGNTGVGLAWVGRLKGYRTVLVMPDSMSVERRKLLKAYGAEIVLTPGSEGMKASIAEAERLHKKIPGSFIPGQFENPANPAAHKSTAKEIYYDSEGLVDIFVATMGTAGTVCGTSAALKALKPSVRCYAVEPAESPLLTKGVAGPHTIQGIGANFIPDNYDASVIDGVIDISGNDAVAGARELVSFGVLGGYSSGAAYMAAKNQALLKENEGKVIVALLPDTGERYLSTTLFSDEQ